MKNSRLSLNSFQRNSSGTKFSNFDFKHVYLTNYICVKLKNFCNNSKYVFKAHFCTSCRF